MKITRFTPRYMDSFPRPLEEGVLYISQRFGMAAHSCACGCGHEVMTPLKPTQWRLTVNPAGGVTLHPSIGNWGFPCRSHYWIRNNKVVWSYQMSDVEIHRNRQLDQAARETYYRRQRNGTDMDSAEVQRPDGPVSSSPADSGPGFIRRLWHALRRR